MQGGCLADYEGGVVVEGGEKEQVCGGVELLDALAVREVADEGDLPVQTLFRDQFFHRVHGISRTDEKHPELLIFNGFQRFDDELDILLPDVLADEEQDELVLAYAHRFAGLDEVFLRIIGAEIAAVVHDLHLAFVSVFADDIFDGSLGDPDLVGSFVKGDDALDDQVHYVFLRDDPGEVVPVFGVEGGDAGDALQFCDPLGGLARTERTVGVDDLEAALGNLPKEGRIHLRYACDIGFAEGDGDREEINDVEVVDAVIRPGDVGCDDGDVADHLLHPVSVIGDTD